MTKSNAVCASIIFLTNQKVHSVGIEPADLMNRIEGTSCQLLDDYSVLKRFGPMRIIVPWVCSWNVYALEGREQRQPLQTGGGGRGLLYRYRGCII